MKNKFRSEKFDLYAGHYGKEILLIVREISEAVLLMLIFY